MRNMILIVDDHLDTCHPLAALLRMEGIETRCHKDPRAAIEDIQRRPIEGIPSKKVRRCRHGTD